MSEPKTKPLTECKHRSLCGRTISDGKIGIFCRKCGALVETIEVKEQGSFSCRRFAGGTSLHAHLLADV